MKPIIGITSDTNYIERSDRYMGLEVNFSQKVFSDAIFAAGGIPYLIPMNAGRYAEDIIHVIDGLILIGGHDVSPLVYAEEPRTKLGEIKPDRDDNDAQLLLATLAKQKPVLGICRGLQLINAVLGGSLHQDLSENETITIQHNQPTKPHYLTHSIKVASKTYLSSLVSDGMLVNSVHHQVINKLAPSLKASAWSQDGVVEAIESKEEIPLILGVQWHPEVLFEEHKEHLVTFTNLIERARQLKFAEFL